MSDVIATPLLRKKCTVGNEKVIIHIEATKAPGPEDLRAEAKTLSRAVAHTSALGHAREATKRAPARARRLVRRLGFSFRAFTLDEEGRVRGGEATPPWT